MSRWIEQADLSQRNSFGFQVTAERYQEITAIDQLQQALDEVETNSWPLLILGGGSNLVLQEQLPGAVISIACTGVKVLANDQHEAIVAAGAGENWHGLVGQLLEMGLHGLENLALIPGSVGAAPVQNIGAYGVELADVLHSVMAFDREQGELVQLSCEECRFGYRDSLFKSVAPGRYIIWEVRFRLSTLFQPQLAYQGLSSYLQAQGVKHPTAPQVYQAICDIRSSKLPVPTQIGNAGSFFENPIVPEQDYLRLKQQHANLVAYPDRPGFYKLAAGWLIDQAGWKGKQVGHVGVYEKQALVLVNHGGGSADELLALADDIKRSVWDKFAVRLQMEPRIYP